MWLRPWLRGLFTLQHDYEFVIHSSAGDLPARTNSIICWRNCTGYGGCDLGILDSFHSKNEVSTKVGELQLVPTARLQVDSPRTPQAFAVR
jgi:hypothetical protein